VILKRVTNKTNKNQLLINKTMGLEYDFYQNPIPPGSNRKPRLHARVVTNGTVTTDELAEIIHDSSTLTTGDVKGVLEMLSHTLLRMLSYGKRVHLTGLGYFQLTLECPPVKTEKDIRAESIKVRSVVFRAEESLKDKARHISLKRVRRKNKSRSYSDIEIDALLTGHFMDNEHITASGFRSLCSLRPATAGRRLRRLVESGKLKPLGRRNSSIYIPVKGNYRK